MDDTKSTGCLASGFVSASRYSADATQCLHLAFRARSSGTRPCQLAAATQAKATWFLDIYISIGTAGGRLLPYHQMHDRGFWQYQVHCVTTMPFLTAASLLHS